MKEKHPLSVVAGSDDSVVYKVPIAFALLIAVLTGLRRLSGYYATLGGFETLHPVFRIAAIVCAALFVLSLIGVLVLRRALFGYCAAVFGLLAVTAGLMWRFWSEYMLQIYLLHVLVYVLYMIWQLYRMEFAAFSFVTILAGMVYFLLSRGISASARVIIPCVLLAVSLVVTAAVTFLCSKNRGALQFGKKKLRLFPPSFNPLILFFVCILWALVLGACLLFGATCAFYCMFAAIAIELVGAVYYTFQLK